MFVDSLDRRFYPQTTDGWDDDLFRERILTYIQPESRVLDLGAGAGLVRQMNFRGKCHSVCGLDPVQEVMKNESLDVAKVGSAENIPWPDSTFDVVFCNNVFEHLPHPERVFSEVFRVLKEGGVFLVKTPNRFHYVTMISAVTPHSFHVFINKIRGRGESDTFSTLYRANSKRRLQELASGFEVIEIKEIEGRPEYTRHGVLMMLYPLGIVWERAVNATSFLSKFRVLLVAAFRKPSPQ
jgi:ubiquinone/menaquinone biosynthesis C-methylase UbiE